MNLGLRAVTSKFECITCLVRPGEPCKRVDGQPMASVHPARKFCPVCGRSYTERGGAGGRPRFYHSDGEPWSCVDRNVAL
jgi:hypothetical protein